MPNKLKKAITDMMDDEPRNYLVISSDPHSLDNDDNMEPNEDIGFFKTFEAAKEKIKSLMEQDWYDLAQSDNMTDEGEEQFSEECDLPLDNLKKCRDDILYYMGTSNHYQMIRELTIEIDIDTGEPV